MRRLLASTMLSALIASCSFPTFDFRATEDGSDAAPSCTGASTKGDACARVPHFSGTQKVDGVGDEFCGLPVSTWDKRTAQLNLPSPPPSGVDPRVELRVGWSDVGLHLHVHVIDAAVLVSPVEQVLHTGDSVEIYASGFVPMGGDYDETTDVGAVHLILAPPGAGLEARALVYSSRYDHPASALSRSLYAGRIVSDGYEIEVQLPWSLITRGAPPIASGGIGLTAAVNAKDVPTDADRALQTFLGFHPVSPGSNSCVGSPGVQPWCDDRTWCTPLLE
ncbi:MAG: hypothetical protein ACXVEF_35730 [Polyangiales bacterium]